MNLFTKFCYAALCSAALVPWAAQANQNWLPPVTLTTDPADSANLVVDDGGNTIAVWADDNNSDIIYAIKPFNGVWSAPTPIPGASGEVPSLAVDPAGNAVATWVDFGINTVYGATLPFGGAWSAPVVITGGGGGGPAIVRVTDTGDAVTVYADATSTLFSASLPFGGAWTAPIQASPNNGASQNNLYAFVMSPNGEAVSIAIDTAGTVAAETLVAGVWSAPVTFASSTNVAEIAATIDPFGNVTFIYVDDITSDLIARQLPYLGVWGAPVILANSISEGIDIIADDSGNVTAAWGDATNGFSASLPFGGAWGAPVSFNPNFTRFVSLAFNPSNGNVIAGYSTSILGSFNIASSEQPFAGPWTGPVIVENTGGDSLAPIIVMDPSDNANILWLGSTGKGGSNGVYTAETALDCPVVTNITPTFGPIDGGTIVTITGINFTGVTQVFFGTTPAASFIVDSDTQITATSPAHIAGPVFVTVVGPECTSPETNMGIFTYLGEGQPAPPASFTGVRGADRFLTQTDYFNYLTWTASPDPTVVSYHLYRNGDSLAFISATSLFVYIDHNRSKYGTDTYQLTAVNGVGVESPALVVVLP